MRPIRGVGAMLVFAGVALLALLVGPRLMRDYAVAEQSARITLARQELSDDDILRRIDRAIAAISDSVMPGVVHIETVGRANGMGGSSGAGWVFDTEGHVVTNSHVVRGAKRVAVEFGDGVVVEGELVGTDVYTDIAVVRVDRRDGLFPVLRSIQRLPRVGDRVFAFGSPFGFKFSMSEGIVSGLGREAPGSSIPGGYTNYVQTDAAVNPGNSGGPLVNTDGHLVGMNVAIATARSIGSSPEDSGGDSAGISFAIPLGTIEPIVRQLIEHGSVERGFMGISFARSRDGLERVVDDAGRVFRGVRVSEVLSGGPSEAAGLRRGDVIVAVAGSPVPTAEALSTLISSGRPGEGIDVRVWRDGALRDVTVVLAPIEAEVLADRFAQPTMLRLGMVVRRGEPGGGVVVERVFDGFPASVAGLRVGDGIERVNGRAVTGWNEFFVLAADEGLLTGEAVELLVLGASGESRTVVVRLER